jgi:diguanylate cyclase (GGDEF)-like protein/PAS domain S-box-containing protein
VEPADPSPQPSSSSADRLRGWCARIAPKRQRRSVDDSDGPLPRERIELLSAVFEQSPIAVLRVRLRGGRPGEILNANPAAGVLLGRPEASLLGTDVGHYMLGLDRFVLGGRIGRLELKVGCDDGRTRWADVTIAALDGQAGRGTGLIVMQDITERKEAEEQLHRAARHDALTGLINRDEIVRRLTELAAAPGAASTNVAVLFADLDGFKAINDTRGHQIGDEVLVAVARRIRAAVRPGDFVGRIGGDEFVVVCPRLPDGRRARSVAERVRATLDAPVAAGGRSHELGVSIGISWTRADRIDPVELLRQADLAMYRAKSTRAGIQFYEVGFDRALQARERLRDDLRSAIMGDGLLLHYQPVVDIASGQLSYIEALVRLVEADGSLIYPEEFLPIAEQAGLLGTLGHRALEAALLQRVRWLAQGYPVTIGIDLPPFELLGGSFVNQVLTSLANRGVPAEALVFEVGELGLVEDSHPAQVSLRRMRAAGIGLAIDHFGTGQSSLSALRNMGADRVKIDRAFVTSVAQSAEDRAVVAATIAVAHAMGQRVIVEGVETAQQLAILAELGCDDVQGFLVAAPGPAQNLDPGRRSWLSS